MPTEKTDCFLDTNVLIYAASEKKSLDARWTTIAERLVHDTLFGTTGQVMAEFVAVGRRKKLLADESIEQWLIFLGTCPFVPVDEAYVRAGFELARRYQIHYYDAALLGAAERLGARVFYTEDLNHGQTYGSVRVVNPFL
jgi:predicted nucleic acid-binding protein